MSNNKNNSKSGTIGRAEDKKLDRIIKSRIQETPIAVVGMASLFPDAKNVSELWNNIYNKVDSIVDVPASRWSIDDYYDPDPTIPDKTYCKRGGFLPDIGFNPMEFGLPPNILEITDSSQLLSLVVAKDVLEDAGVGEDSNYDRDRIGITLGIGGGQKLSTSLSARLQYPVLERILVKSGVSKSDAQQIIDRYKMAFAPWEENSFPGLLGNVIAGRIANRFNLGGINAVLDAACASSLAAAKMAVSELLEGHSDMMITGGACTDNSIFMYMSFSKTPAFSTNGKIQPFDSDSKGMMVGEGVGMIALKRLEDAERDGDRIYSVIRGVGSSSDGKFKSIYAPRPAGQMKALQRAYESAGFEPQSIGLLEAHGTGTAAGDVAEFSALNDVFTNKENPKQHIALGSVKSQIGHLKAAAGIAGFIKVSLALHHKVLPPTINVTSPNSKLKIEESAFYLNTEARPWLPAEDGSPRRAGVSAFGFGGTNFHFAVEEYQRDLLPRSRLNKIAQSSLIHAESGAKLVQACEAYIAQLNNQKELGRYQSFLQATKINGCPADHVRLGFVSETVDEAIKLLDLAVKTVTAKPDAEHWEVPQGIYFRNAALDVKGKVVALFSGQGSQYPNMGDDLTANFTEVMNTAAKMDRIFIDAGKGRLSDRVHPIPVFDAVKRSLQERELQQTQYAQPSIGVFSMGSYKIFANAGFKPDFVAGHSFGELTALWASGVISEDDYLKLAFVRGQAMAAPDDENFDAGSMLAVVGDIDGLDELLKKFPSVVKANNNSRTQVVLAGPDKDIVKVQELLQNKEALQGKEYKAIALPVSAAFHTPLVGHAQKPFSAVVETVKFNIPSIPVYSNASGKVHPSSGDAIKKALKGHILEPVNFRNEIDSIYQDGGSVFIEFGPKNVLTKLVDNILEGKTHLAIAVNASPKKSADRQLRQAVLQLAVAGLSLKNIDPYKADVPITNTEKPSPMNITLSAPNYRSEKTEKAFEAALNAGFQIEKAVASSATQLSSETSTTIASQAITKPAIAKPAVKAEVVALVKSSVATKEEKPEAETTTMMTKSSETAPVAVQTIVSGDKVIESIEWSLKQFYSHQEQTLKVHEQYLESPREYSQMFSQLMQQQVELIANNPGIQIPEGIERSMTMFHQHQSETLRIHEQYLKTQAEATTQSLDVMKGQYSILTRQSVGTSALVGKASVASTPAVTLTAATAPVATVQPMVKVTAPAAVVAAPKIAVAKPAPVASAPIAVAPIVKSAPAVKAPAPVASAPVARAQSNDFANQIKTSMLTVVAEKTGYPVEMLDFDMDMEADLGIDSIKRVEILGTVQEHFPQLPEMNPDEMAEMRTLGQIVAYMERQLSDVAPAAVAPAVASVAPAVASTVVPSTVAAADSQIVSQLTNVMLSVVADKTGYPTEMLDLEMDMEADLGIDSIKRVEILGTVTEEFPGLPDLNPDELAELRTLGQIIGYMKSQLGAAVAPAISVAATAATAVVAAAAVASVASALPVGIDANSITTTMLSVVAQKTGYPMEMLELEMDMEADLGIDSIKRVEILGTVQEAFPGLPELNPEEMSELRTLGEIVNNMKAQLQSVAPTAAPAVAAPLASTSEVASTSAAPAVSVAAASAGIDVSKLTDVMLAVVAEKTGYPTEMLELEMDMEADLGIDSIKRVEILGTVQDEFPGLPEMKPEEMSEMRTLGQIIDYMKSTVSAMPASVIAPATVAPAVTTKVGVDQLTQTMMAVVADKTGYPVEMLELDMDMEADLGIDSIKRVEILGTVQESHPGLQNINSEALAELRTLGEIVAYMTAELGTDSVAPVTAATTPLTAVTNPAAVVASGVAQTATGVKVNLSQLTDTMMRVVAEKTGYPVEMLELDMDMEADLGIDSIKRVEILGTVQESFPELPDMNPDILAELRTLGEIVQSMGNQLRGAGDASTAVAQATVESTVKMEGASVKKWLSPGVNSGVARVKLLANPDQLLFPIASDRSCIITDDGTQLTTELSDGLARIGYNVVVLQFPTNIVPQRSQLADSIAQIELQNMNEDHLAEVLKVIGQEMGQVAHFVHLDPCYEPGAWGGLDYSETKKLILRHVFLMAKHLKSALNTPSIVEGHQNCRNSFVTVAHLDGRLGYGDAQCSVVAGGLFGLTKTVNLEWPSVFCRSVDLHSDINAANGAAMVLAEMLAADIDHVEVGYMLEGRATLEAETVSAIPPAGNHINRDSVFLVSGGAKGVTSQCVVKLAQTHQCKFILLGRSAYDGQEPEWAAGVSDENQLKQRAMELLKSTGEKPTPVKVQSVLRPVLSQREIGSVLNDIAAAGGQAIYLACDVTDAYSLHQQLPAAVQQLGPITGVIHGAGVLADKLIEKKTVEDFESVYTTKVDGLNAIFHNVELTQLKHLVLFSSAAGFYGNAAQSDYSIANEILNKTAKNFKAQYPDCHVISFDWGPWDGGMVTPQLKKLFAERNIEVIPIEGGTQLFVDDLSAETNYATQILVGSTMEFDSGALDPTLHSYRIARSITIEENPFLYDHAIGGNPVVPMAAAASWMAEAAKSLFPGYHFAGMEHLRLFKGIVLDGSSPTHYFLDLEEVAKGEEVKLTATIWSNGEKRLNHYAADVILSQRAKVGPVIDTLDLTEQNPVEGSIVYCDGTLFHGPKFQLIKKVMNCTSDHLTLLCKAPNHLGSTLGQFTTYSSNALITDINFQAMLVWVRKNSDSGSLPASVEHYEQFGLIPEGQEFYVTLQVRESSASKMIADVMMHDANGKLYSRLSSAQVTVSKTLNHLFETER